MLHRATMKHGKCKAYFAFYLLFTYGYGRNDTSDIIMGLKYLPSVATRDYQDLSPQDRQNGC